MCNQFERNIDNGIIKLECEDIKDLIGIINSAFWNNRRNPLGV